MVTQVETGNTVGVKQALARLKKDENEAIRATVEGAVVFVTYHAGQSNERDGEVYQVDSPMFGVPGRHRANLTRQEAADTIKGAQTATIVPEDESPWGE